ncbi:MAG: hypothetical protein HQK54_05790 [Oligoflexales bacterium]|nr:hypothetical protein [Oligoflexales bacterium]
MEQLKSQIVGFVNKVMKHNPVGWYLDAKKQVENLGKARHPCPVCGQPGVKYPAICIHCRCTGVPEN